MISQVVYRQHLTAIVTAVKDDLNAVASLRVERIDSAKFCCDLETPVFRQTL